MKRTGKSDILLLGTGLRGISVKGGVMVKKIESETPWEDKSMEEYEWVSVCLQRNSFTEKVFQPAWQAYKYLLGGKMYAYVGVHKNQRPILTLKLEPMYSETLRKQYEDIIPGYYMNKIHWSTIYLDGDVPYNVIEEIIDVSHKHAFSSLSKKEQETLKEKALKEKE